MLDYFKNKLSQKKDQPNSVNNNSQENIDEAQQEKQRYLKRIAAGVLVIVVAAYGIIVVADPFHTFTLKRADIVEFDPSSVEDYDISGASSECFYSTNVDRDIKDNFKIFKDQQSFDSWYESHHDIIRTSPSQLPESNSDEYFNQGYYAVVTSPTDLFDTSKSVLATAKFKGPEGELVYSIGQMNRSNDYEYDTSLEECKQIYTVIYINPSDIKDADSIAFAIEPVE